MTSTAAKTSFLSRDSILEAKDIRTEEVSVPEWGGTVLVKGMTGAERDSLEQSSLEIRGRSQRMNVLNFRAKLCIRSIVDPENMQPIFTEQDIAALGRKSAAALQRVFNVASRLSGITEEDVEELTKNSSDGQNGNSTSNSH